MVSPYPGIDNTAVTTTGTTYGTNDATLTCTVSHNITSLIIYHEAEKAEVYFDENDTYRIREGINACKLQHNIAERNKQNRLKRSDKEMNRGFRGLNKIYFGRKGRNFKALAQ